MPEIITGNQLSEGIGFGSIIISNEVDVEITRETIASNQIETEIKAYKDSVQKAHVQLRKLRENVGENLDEDSAAIFDAHIMMLDDPGFNEQIIEHIKAQNNAESAIESAGKVYVEKFETLESEYMRARALDVKDICLRLINNIRGVEVTDLTHMTEPVVIIAEELTPSASAQLDSKYVNGIVTAKGGMTSHAAIIARSLNIPLVSGIEDIVEKVNEGDDIIVDGFSGDVVISPTEVEFAAYSEKQKLKRRRMKNYKN